MVQRGVVNELELHEFIVEDTRECLLNHFTEGSVEASIADAVKREERQIRGLVLRVDGLVIIVNRTKVCVD